MSLITQPLSVDLSTLSARTFVNPAARAAVKLAVVLVTWNEAYRSRQVLKQLTPDQLRDVGLTRSQALIEAKRGFWCP